MAEYLGLALGTEKIRDTFINDKCFGYVFKLEKHRLTKIYPVDYNYEEIKLADPIDIAPEGYAVSNDKSIFEILHIEDEANNNGKYKSPRREVDQTEYDNYKNNGKLQYYKKARQVFFSKHSLESIMYQIEENNQFNKQEPLTNILISGSGLNYGAYIPKYKDHKISQTNYFTIKAESIDRERTNKDLPNSAVGLPCPPDWGAFKSLTMDNVKLAIIENIRLSASPKTLLSNIPKTNLLDKKIAEFFKNL